MPSHRQPLKSSARKTSHSSDNQLSFSLKSKLKIALVAAPVAMFSWIGHSGAHSLLKNEIKSKDAAIGVFEGKNTKLEKLRNFLNKDFEPDTARKPYRIDTVYIPDNVTASSQSNFVQNIKAIFCTPPLDPEEVRTGLLKIDNIKRNEDLDFSSLPSPDIHIGDKILWDENGKKYFAVDYYSK